jgi:hypothetical protein
VLSLSRSAHTTKQMPTAFSLPVATPRLTHRSCFIPAFGPLIGERVAASAMQTKSRGRPGQSEKWAASYLKGHGRREMANTTLVNFQDFHAKARPLQLRRWVLEGSSKASFVRVQPRYFHPCYLRFSVRRCPGIFLNLVLTEAGQLS